MPKLVYIVVPRRWLPGFPELPDRSLFGVFWTIHAIVVMVANCGTSFNLLGYRFGIFTPVNSYIFALFGFTMI